MTVIVVVLLLALGVSLFQLYCTQKQFESSTRNCHRMAIVGKQVMANILADASSAKTALLHADLEQSDLPLPLEEVERLYESASFAYGHYAMMVTIYEEAQK